MPRKVVYFRTYHLAKPFSDMRVVHIVVIHPILITCVVGRIDVNAFDSILVFREQGFEGFKIVAMDNHIAAVGGVAEGIFAVEHPKRHVVVMGDDLVFANPIQCGHNVVQFVSLNFSNQPTKQTWAFTLYVTEAYHGLDTILTSKAHAKNT